MRKVIHLFYSTMFLAVAFSASALETDYAKVLTSMPITIGQTVDVSASFEGISPGAIKLGLDESQLSGTANYTDLGQNKTRVTITWHTLKVQAGNFVENEALTPSLFSKVITDSNIDPNTSMTITGNLAKVLESFKKAKNRAEAKNSGTSTFSENNINNDEDEPVKVSDLSPAATSSGSGTGGNTGSTDTSAAPSSDLTPTAALQSTEKVSCAPRIDELNSIVFKQESTVTSAGGEILSTSACADTNISVPIVTTAEGCGYEIVSETLFLKKRKYAILDGANINVTDCTIDPNDPQPTTAKRQDCGVLPSVAENLVYLKYKEVGNVDGQDVEVTSCTVNTAESLPITRNTTGCKVRHDFIAGETIQQEKISYEENQTVKYINDGVCTDSSTVYAHYLTEQTCSVITDDINGTVFLQERVAYNDSSGLVNYATECTPSSTGSYTVLSEYCPTKYEHVNYANVSYTNSRTYYNHPTNGKVYLSACARNQNESYTHNFSAKTCTTDNNDAGHETTFYRNRSITTPDDGVVILNGCEIYGDPVPYTLVSEGILKVSEKPIYNTYVSAVYWSAYLYIMQPGDADIYIGVDPNGCNFNEMQVANGLSEISGVAARKVHKVKAFIGSTITYAHCTIYDTTQQFHKYWLRGDGTNYDQLVSTVSKVSG